MDTHLLLSDNEGDRSSYTSDVRVCEGPQRNCNLRVECRARRWKKEPEGRGMKRSEEDELGHKIAE